MATEKIPSSCGVNSRAMMTEVMSCKPIMT